MEQITVALIGVVGAVIVTLLEKARRENKEDHGYVREHLTRIEYKIDDHINDHAVASFDFLKKKTTPKKKETKNGNKKVR
jgi:hypothetical protein